MINFQNKNWICFTIKIFVHFCATASYQVRNSIIQVVFSTFFPFCSLTKNRRKAKKFANRIAPFSVMRSMTRLFEIGLFCQISQSFRIWDMTPLRDKILNLRYNFDGVAHCINLIGSALVFAPPNIHSWWCFPDIFHEDAVQYLTFKRIFPNILHEGTFQFLTRYIFSTAISSTSKLLWKLGGKNSWAFWLFWRS